jgi:hypothetical protein
MLMENRNCAIGNGAPKVGCLRYFDRLDLVWIGLTRVLCLRSTANVLSLLSSEDGLRDVLKNNGATTKRGKKIKPLDGDGVENVKISSSPEARINENQPPCDEHPQPPNPQSPNTDSSKENNTAIDAGPSAGAPLSTREHSSPNTPIESVSLRCSSNINTPIESSVVTATLAKCIPEAPSATEIRSESTTPSQVTLEQSGSMSPVVNESQTSLPCTLDQSQPMEGSSAASEEPKSPTKPKNKKKRRTTRSLSPVPNIKKRCSERHSVLRRQIESLLGLGLDDEASTQTDIEVHRLKLDMLEKLVSEDDVTAYFFAIAGKKLFEPEGSMQKQLVKRLGRNAGSIRAPFIAYETPFEVAESTTCHNWRYMTLNGTTFEDFILSFKFFSEHIDRSVR